MTHSFRHDFPALTDAASHYLDSAATTHQPASVIAAQQQALTTGVGPVHRTIYPLGVATTQAYEAVRSQIADFTGAAANEVILTRNATEALNLAAWIEAPNIQAGDEIVLSVAEHHSNLLPWQRLACKRMAKLVWLDVNADGHMDMADVRQKITERTKVVALTHVSNVLGTIMPVSAIAALAHRVGARVVLDATQSAGRLPLNREELGADYLAISAHKMYGPTGVGALIGRQEILVKAEPMIVGGGMVTHVTEAAAIWAQSPQRFEAGTPNTVGVIGWGAAINYVHSLDWETIATHDQQLTAYLLQELQKIPGVQIVGSTLLNNRVGIVSLRVQAGPTVLHSHDVAEVLASHNVAVRAGHHCAQPLLEHLGLADVVRISTGIYTTNEDIDAVISAIRAAQAALAAPIKKQATVPSH